MGGNTIYDILSQKETNLIQLKTIIIEPQSNISLPIEFLLSHGYINDDGKYVYEKRYYPLLRFIKGKESISDLEKKYGPYPVRNKDSLLKEMLRKEIHQLDPYVSKKETLLKQENLKQEFQEIFHEAA